MYESVGVIGKGKAQKLREVALHDPYDSHIFNLGILVNIVLHYQVHLSNIADEIDALASEIEEYEILQSIPGVGEKIAATIISEIGEIDRFNGAKKLVVFAGIDPSKVYCITKRGSCRLRHALYMAVQ